MSDSALLKQSATLNFLFNEFTKCINKHISELLYCLCTTCIKQDALNNGVHKVNQGLEAFFERYGEAYSALDANATSSMFALPFMTIHQGQGTVWETMDLLLPATASLLGWFEQQGFLNATYKIKDILQIDTHFATVNLIWSVTRLESDPWQYGTCYHLKRDADDWKIYGVVQFDAVPEIEEGIDAALRHKHTSPGL
ncbi:hypothetical protein EV682_12419 [Iodobacter fluviatilis]|uniref:SnoaL-like domain-containing protein n=1 Tax=Iodobacter fluviatilis TaxID=537 RepID=A0A377Q8T6_9NEIS|nr:hypothetical protein EV682_12419 [Iodobacter fluviatilis]STQ91696.1 Uncharacterised protein [Iodobacter fluviatilis]